MKAVLIQLCWRYWMSEITQSKYFFSIPDFKWRITKEILRAQNIQCVCEDSFLELHRWWIMEHLLGTQWQQPVFFHWYMGTSCESQVEVHLQWESEWTISKKNSWSLSLAPTLDHFWKSRPKGRKLRFPALCACSCLIYPPESLDGRDVCCKWRLIMLSKVDMLFHPASSALHGPDREH